MEKSTLFEKTGRLVFQIQKFDMLLSVCLTYAYVGVISKEVFDDIIHPLAFQTKLTILKKLVARKGLKFDFGKAEKYKKIRNTIIHGQGFDEDLLHLRSKGDDLQIETLFDQFEEVRESLEDELMKIMKEMGMTEIANKDEYDVDSHDFPIWNKKKAEVKLFQFRPKQPAA